ncbi:hypothetical protein BH10CYA1_BH10CYA1_59800 [soil metagenome]
MSHNVSHRSIKPSMSDPPDKMVFCENGPHNQKLMKVRMLSNLSDGQYQKDPACTWTDAIGHRYPLYRWNPKCEKSQAK